MQAFNAAASPPLSPSPSPSPSPPLPLLSSPVVENNVSAGSSSASATASASASGSGSDSVSGDIGDGDGARGDKDVSAAAAAVLFSFNADTCAADLTGQNSAANADAGAVDLTGAAAGIRSRARAARVGDAPALSRVSHPPGGRRPVVGHGARATSTKPVVAAIRRARHIISRQKNASGKNISVGSHTSKEEAGLVRFMTVNRREHSLRLDFNNSARGYVAPDTPLQRVELLDVVRPQNRFVHGFFGVHLDLLEWMMMNHVQGHIMVKVWLAQLLPYFFAL